MTNRKFILFPESNECIFAETFTSFILLIIVFFFLVNLTHYLTSLLLKHLAEKQNHPWLPESHA